MQTPTRYKACVWDLSHKSDRFLIDRSEDDRTREDAYADAKAFQTKYAERPHIHVGIVNDRDHLHHFWIPRGWERA